MTTDPERGRGEGRGAGAESWLRLSEGLVGGVHHALNNRMAALRAVGQVVETDLPANHPLAGALEAELDRLEETASLLSLLRGGEDSFLPIQVEDVLRQAARLFGMHHALRDRELEVESSPGLLPVLGSPERLLRGILLMIAATARDGARRIALRADGDERVVRITVSPLEADAPQDDPDLQGIGFPAIEQVLERAGATGSVEGGEMRATILTLPEARRMEKEGTTNVE